MPVFLPAGLFMKRALMKRMKRVASPFRTFRVLKLKEGD